MIELEHVSRKFGNFYAVNDVSFSIQTGEIVGLLGPNGAGKTTTMRMITGYLEASSGSIKVDGIDVTQDSVETKAKIGYMPESAPLYSDMIVADYLEYVAQMQGQDPKEKVPYLAQVCGLKEVMHKNIADLSRGNKQRVGLAHALMGDPEILILDEPTSGLDPNQVSEVRELIRKIGETRTVIISTHILSEVEMLCNRVIIISDGKKVADSSTQSLREHFNSNSQVVLELSNKTDSKEAEAVLSKIEGISSIKCSTAENRLICEININGDENLCPQIASKVVKAGMDLYSMQVKKNSLEDVFRTLTLGGDEK